MKDFKPRDFLGYLVVHAMKAISKRLVEHFAEAGYEISRPQWMVLVKSYHLAPEGVLQSEIVEMMLGDKTIVTRAVDDLVKQGLLNRQIDQNDRRNRILTITPKGRAIIPPLMQCVNKTLAEATENIAPDDLGICKKVLSDIIDNLNVPTAKE